jgi:spore coat protein A
LISTNVPFNPATPQAASVLVAPAERPDVIVDFSAHAGQSIILYNDAPAPFPGGDPRYDYFPGWNVKGNPINGATPNGFGPNSRVLMRFNVGMVASSIDPPLLIDTTTDLSAGIDAPLIPFGSSVVPAGVPVRQLTLNELFDNYGRLIQMEGTAAGALPYEAPATEVVQQGTTEVWEIANNTADTHPIHFHLVNLQVINRQAQNKIAPALPNETGWKETVWMMPGTITRVIMKFSLPSVPFSVPASPRTGGNEYVWHCHILEHEEHDMMRPLVVTGGTVA